MQRRPDTAPSAEPGLQAVERYIDALWLERGLSAHTAAAYRRDLTATQHWLHGRGSDLCSAPGAELMACLAARGAAGLSPRSLARLVSSLRGFYRHLRREGLREDDPSELIAPPRLGRPLPASLSEADVEALLAAPDTATAIGLRDRTMPMNGATAYRRHGVRWRERQQGPRALGPGGGTSIQPRHFVRQRTAQEAGGRGKTPDELSTVGHPGLPMRLGSPRAAGSSPVVSARAAAAPACGAAAGDAAAAAASAPGASS